MDEKHIIDSPASTVRLSHISTNSSDLSTHSADRVNDADQRSDYIYISPPDSLSHQYGASRHLVSREERAMSLQNCATSHGIGTESLNNSVLSSDEQKFESSQENIDLSITRENKLESPKYLPLPKVSSLPAEESVSTLESTLSLSPEQRSELPQNSQPLTSALEKITESQIPPQDSRPNPLFQKHQTELSQDSEPLEERLEPPDDPLASQTSLAKINDEIGNLLEIQLNPYHEIYIELGSFQLCLDQVNFKLNEQLAKNETINAEKWKQLAQRITEMIKTSQIILNRLLYPGISCMERGNLDLADRTQHILRYLDGSIIFLSQSENQFTPYHLSMINTMRQGLSYFRNHLLETTFESYP